MLAKGALKEAAEMLRQIIAVDPRNADARMVLGTTLALEGIHSESTQQLMEAVRLRPGSGGS